MERFVVSNVLVVIASISPKSNNRLTVLDSWGKIDLTLRMEKWNVIAKNHFAKRNIVNAIMQD